MSTYSNNAASGDTDHPPSAIKGNIASIVGKMTHNPQKQLDGNIMVANAAEQKAAKFETKALEWENKGNINKAQKNRGKAAIYRQKAIAKMNQPLTTPKGAQNTSPLTAATTAGYTQPLGWTSGLDQPIGTTNQNQVNSVTYTDEPLVEKKTGHIHAVGKTRDTLPETTGTGLKQPVQFADSPSIGTSAPTTGATGYSQPLTGINSSGTTGLNPIGATGYNQSYGTTDFSPVGTTGLNPIGTTVYSGNGTGYNQPIGTTGYNNQTSGITGYSQPTGATGFNPVISTTGLNPIGTTGYNQSIGTTGYNQSIGTTGYTQPTGTGTTGYTQSTPIATTGLNPNGTTGLNPIGTTGLNPIGTTEYNGYNQTGYDQPIGTTGYDLGTDGTGLNQPPGSAYIAAKADKAARCEVKAIEYERKGNLAKAQRNRERAWRIRERYSIPHPVGARHPNTYENYDADYLPS